MFNMYSQKFEVKIGLKKRRTLFLQQKKVMLFIFSISPSFPSIFFN